MSSAVQVSIRALILAAGFVVFWLGAVVLAWIYAPMLGVVLPDGLEKRRRVQRIVGRWFQVLHRALAANGLVDVRVEVPRLHEPSVLIANHPTLIDVTAILAHVPDACCLVKPSLARNPLVGPLLSAAGYVDAGDGSPAEGRRALLELSERLREGFHVVIFPEGTRSPAYDVHAFHRGAFELASRTHAPLVPALITCEPPCFAKGAPVWRFPTRRADLHVGLAPAITAEQRALPSRELARAVEASYRAALPAAPLKRPLVDAKPSFAEGVSRG